MRPVRPRRVLLGRHLGAAGPHAATTGLHVGAAGSHAAATELHVGAAGPHAAATELHARAAGPHAAATELHARATGPHAATTGLHVGAAGSHAAAAERAARTLRSLAHLGASVAAWRAVRPIRPAIAIAAFGSNLTGTAAFGWSVLRSGGDEGRGGEEQAGGEKQGEWSHEFGSNPDEGAGSLGGAATGRSTSAGHPRRFIEFEVLLEREGDAADCRLLADRGPTRVENRANAVVFGHSRGAAGASCYSRGPPWSPAP